MKFRRPWRTASQNQDEGLLTFSDPTLRRTIEENRNTGLETTTVEIRHFSRTLILTF